MDNAPLSMTKIFSVLFKSALVMVTSSATGAPVQLDMDSSCTTENTFTTDQGFAFQTLHLSGRIHADVTIDPITRMPTHFRFTEGAVHYSDGTTTYTPTVFPQVEQLVFTYTGLSGPYTTINPNATVDPVSGALNNADHVIILNSGTLLTEYKTLVFGNWITLLSETHDYAQEPANEGASGTNTVTATHLASNSLFDQYRIDFTTLADSTPQNYDLDGFALTVTSVGTHSATGNTLVPSAAYTNWLENSCGITPTSIYDKIQGESAAILFALGLPSGEKTIPQTLDPGNSTYSLDLPDTGTRVDLKIEHSTDLENWTAIDLGSGQTTLPAGSSTDLNLSLPAGEKHFLRIVLAE